MQTTKLLSVIGLVAAFLAFAPTRGAGDTQDQIKAREALRQKMSELNTPSVPAPGTPAPPPAAPANPAKPAPPAAPPQTAAPAAAPKKAPVVQAAPAAAAVAAPAPAPAVAAPGTSKFAPVPAAVEDPNVAKARAALRQEEALLGGAEFAPVPEAVEDPNAAQALAALRQEIALLERASAPAIRPKKSDQTVASVAPLVMEVPLSPLSGPKAARLAELLNRYNANQITPKDYHTQRAAIIAEP